DGDTHAPPQTHLSDRERELVALVAQGLTNQQIAERLHLAVRTVAANLTRIRGKLGARDRVQLVAIACGRELLDVGDAPPDLQDRWVRLTGRERDVMSLLAQGLTTNRQLGDRLGLAPDTVQNPINRMLRKLGAANRADLVM